MKATVSVALCTYNGERYLARQLRSILAQSTPPHEIVIADDGSTDSTLAVAAAELADSGIAVTVLRGTAPLGVVRNFERAISATTGELIVLCDQDDVWHPDRIATAVADLESDERLLLWHSDARLVDDGDADLGFSLFESLGVSAADIERINDGASFPLFTRRNLVTGATTVFRRRLLDSALPFPSEWVHDEWLAIIASATGRVRASTSAEIDYRQHESNEIGVVRPTLRRKVARMLEPRRARYVGLAERADVLVRRLGGLDVAPEVVALAIRKQGFERTRAAYPANRLARIRPVLSEALRGNYTDLSSQGRLDVLRDLLQPA